MTFKDVFQGKTILITGHTGFKGTWLTCWLQELGANLIGFSDQEYFLFSKLGLAENMNHWIGDVREFDVLRKCFDVSRPEIVIHLAAQSLVSQGYLEPKETMETNILGALNILECCREFPPKALLIVSSDKVYLPDEKSKTEEDRLGGSCPYSSSKAAMEMVVLGYKNLLQETFIATARAGNVIGAGDRGKNRLVVDLISAWEHKKAVKIRFPQATRPWQHVLDCLNGYLLLIEKLLQGEGEGAWNFAPEESFSVQEFVEEVQSLPWVDISVEFGENQIFESQFLCINSLKSIEILNWKNNYFFKETILALFRDEFQLKQVKSSNMSRDIILKRIEEFSKQA